MPLVTIGGAQAVENARYNPLAIWPSRGEIGNRLEPLARPGFTPSFHFSAGEKIFTIGSCFARNIELVLEQCGFEIPTRAIIRSNPEFATIGQNVLNNFGTPSILNEIRWAFDPEFPFVEEDAFFEIYPGKFIDVHLSHALKKPAALEIVRARRNAILEAYRAMCECRIIILTLGLAECWFDRTTGIYLNTSPRRSMIRAEPDRFELRVMDYHEIHAALEHTLQLIRAHGGDETRVILTVSPVPLTSTFRGGDVMVANSYSKAVLRSAAEAATTAHDFVDYYPSYESITHSERHAALLDDQIHPTNEVVWLNTTRMVRAYVGADALGPQDIRETIGETPLAALSLLGDRADLLAANPDLAVLLLGAAMRTGRTDLIAMALPYVGDLLPDAELNVARARVALAEGNAAAAAAMLSEEPARRAARANFWSTKLAAAIEVGDLDEARTVAMAWSESNPRTVEPFRLLAIACGKGGRLEQAEALFQAAFSVSDEDARLTLDYIDFLVVNGREEEARPLIENVVPTNPSHTERLGRMRLWTSGGGAADANAVAKATVAA